MDRNSTVSEGRTESVCSCVLLKTLDSFLLGKLIGLSRQSGTGRGMKPEGAMRKGITLYRTAIGESGLNPRGG